MKKSGKDRLKYAINESTLSTADAVPLPQWGRRRGGGFAAKKKANPASRRSAAPSKGRGSRGYSLLPMEGGAPKGRRLDGESGMKESEGDRLKSTIYESALSTAARSPFPNGEGSETRMRVFSHRQSEYGIRGEKNNDGQSLLRVGKVASGASRIGY